MTDAKATLADQSFKSILKHWIARWALPRASVAALLLGGCLPWSPPGVAQPNGFHAPPEPPPVHYGPSEYEQSATTAFAPLAVDDQQEWILHKTEDSEHPNGEEQAYVWLMNRARQNPSAEGAFLVDTGDNRVESAINYFDVDRILLREEFHAIPAKPPAAFDRRLYAAAKAHSEDLIDRDAQDHDGQFPRVGDAGFSFLKMRGNVFSYATHALYGHAGFNIDWGLALAACKMAADTVWRSCPSMATIPMLASRHCRRLIRVPASVLGWSPPISPRPIPLRKTIIIASW